MKSTAQGPAMPKEVEALRTALDSRLTALEKALADPGQHSLLESLILDLARVATDEAEATTRQAILAAQAAAQKVVEASRADAAKALEDEKTESTALRHVIEEAKAALKQAEVALKEERRASEAAAREAAAAERQLAAMRESLEQEQSARAAQLRELEAARSAVETERARASSVEQQIAQAREAGESERAALASELDRQRTAVEEARASGVQLIHQRGRLEEQFATVSAELKASQGELETLRRDLASIKTERDTAQRDLDAARREIEGVRRDSDARTSTLSRSQAEHEQVIKAAQEAARSAEARVDEAIRERDAAQSEVVTLKQQLQIAENAIHERDALQAAHDARDAAEAANAARSTEPDATLDIDSETVVDLTTITRDEERQLAIEKRIRALELALRDAETRAELAEVELDQVRAARGEAEERARPAHGQAAAPAAPVAQTAEQYRGPARAAKRVQFKGDTDIQIDGTPGKLVDLSVTGAQILTPSAMKPNRLVKVTLPTPDSAIACGAKVMWSRLEPRAGELWYRAGVLFTSVDQIALEAFLETQTKTN